jgi:hypothetical protein
MIAHAPPDHRGARDFAGRRRIRDNTRLVRSGTRIAVLVLAALVGWPAPLRAHDVVVDQIVNVDAQAQNHQLVVRLRVPASALGDAKMPHRPDGTLDDAAAADPLRVVTADVARNLDLRQGDVTLALTATDARIGDDRRSVEVALTYPIDGDARELSARLNTFRGTPLNPVRTNVRFQPLAGPVQELSTTGAAARVRFDPSALDTAQEFFERALRVVLGGGDQLLFLVCLLAPMRRAKSAAVLVAWMLLGQLSAMAIGTSGLSARSGVVPAFACIAASAVVIAALQNIVRAENPWVGWLALGFGFANGWMFADVLAPAQQFAGGHRVLAGLITPATIVGSEIWLAAVMWGTRSWLDGIGVPNTVVVFLASIVIGHSALHRMAERADMLAQTGTWAGDHAVTMLVVAWSCVMLIIAGRAALRRREIGDRPALDRVAG